MSDLENKPEEVDSSGAGRSNIVGNDVINSLEIFVSKTAVGAISDDCFELAVKASFSKCFDFIKHIMLPGNSEHVYFSIPILRSVCEDIIVLAFLRSCMIDDRSELLKQLMLHETLTGIKAQHAFFRLARPQQPVLSPGDDKALDKVEDEIRLFWQRNGWPNMSRGTMPPTRQIAEKQGREVLAILYDYIFRLTSSTVHFNVSSLIRTGWGPDVQNLTFTHKNFGAYYLSFAETYGLFLFCLYFELFESVIPSSEVADEVEHIRKRLFYLPRWAEMVTFEEMNMVPPRTSITNMLASAWQSISTSRLLDLMNSNVQQNPPSDEL